jgi:ribosomal protein S18 acetylase RimI-like enzyme
MLAAIAGLPKTQIADLWVDPEHRRKGAGPRLLVAAERYARRRYGAEITVNVDDGNAVACAFWSSLGFRCRTLTTCKPVP